VVVAAVPLLAGSAAAQHEVSFPTTDGGVVYADVYGRGSRGVVLAHGGRFTKDSWAEQAPQIAAAGFRVVAIDFRGRGHSHGGPEASGDAGVEYDVLAAVRYLRESDATSVSLVGASFGGWAVARAAVAAPEGWIDRIVLLVASGVSEPERLPGRKLFVVARDDRSGGAPGTPRLPGIRRQFERASEPKEIVVLDGSAHAQFLFQTDQGARLMREILRFLTRP